LAWVNVFIFTMVCAFAGVIMIISRKEIA